MVTMNVAPTPGGSSKYLKMETQITLSGQPTSRLTRNTLAQRYRIMKRLVLLVAVLLIPTNLHAAIFSGLEAYYSFDALDGSDSSGNNLHLSLFGGIGFEPGLFGNALAPNGNNSKYAARTQNDTSLNFGTGDFTIQTWVNFNNLNGEQVIAEKFTGSTGPGWSLFKLTGSTFGFATDSGAVPIFQSPSQTVTLNTWHNLTIRKTSGLYQLFFNNQVIASASPPQGSTTTAPLLLGRRNSTDGRDFSLEGSMDEVAIWSRSLTNQEISTLYNSGQGQSVPEPTTFILATLAFAILQKRRR